VAASPLHGANLWYVIDDHILQWINGWVSGTIQQIFIHRGHGYVSCAFWSSALAAVLEANCGCGKENGD
jgi:hypothetical protein